MIFIRREQENTDLWIHAYNELGNETGFIWVSLMPHAVLRLHNIHVFDQIYSDDSVNHKRGGIGTVLLYESSQFGVVNDRCNIVGQLKPTPYTEEAKKNALGFYRQFGVIYKPENDKDDLCGSLNIVSMLCKNKIRVKHLHYRVEV